MFIDRVELRVKSGNGGNGCVSFRRERYVPRGGPDGGDGGRGGDVVIRVQSQMRTLLDLRYRREYAAKKGMSGEGARKTGKSSPPVVINVPPGTLVEDSDTGETIADLTGDKDDGGCTVDFLEAGYNTFRGIYAIGSLRCQGTCLVEVDAFGTPYPDIHDIEVGGKN